MPLGTVLCLKYPPPTYSNLKLDFTLSSGIFESKTPLDLGNPREHYFGGIQTIRRNMIPGSASNSIWVLVIFLQFSACSAAFALEPLPAQNALRPVEVKVSPDRIHSNEPVEITIRAALQAKVVTLQYQTVDPGKYIAVKDAAYKSQWTDIPMVQSQPSSQATYTSQIPVSVQLNRRLVRYRFRILTMQDQTRYLPALDDPEPNFAYFVYDGVPPWKGAVEPRSRDPKRGEVVEFGTNAMTQVQNYFLIGKARDIQNATWYEQSNDKDYKYTGTFVADGKVYDHVRFRARGGVWRHAMGKNMWKVDFNKGHLFQAKDDYGEPYKTKWSKLNLRPCIQQGDYGRRGEQGMYESVGFRLFNLAGVEAPRTHWISWRIVDEPVENPPSQYHGDFWGLYLAIENEDRHFLTEHGLPDGNLYKMMFGEGELSNQGANQVTNKSDLHQFTSGLHRNQTDNWWRTNVDLPRYYSYRSILEAIHHYDIDAGKNYDFYLNPKTSQWTVIPWDIDLTWADHMYGGGHEPFMHPVLSRPTFQLEYQNRLREIRDLLFNADETDRLIDECAALISNQKRPPSIADADRAKWDYHPIMASRYVIQQKAGQGQFYQASETGDFAGMVRQMKQYVRNRAAYIDRSLLDDSSIPITPTIAFTGKPGNFVNDLSLKSSAFSGSGQFAAMKWRIGEVDPRKPINGKPARRGHYEITPIWESGELGVFKPEIAVPQVAMKPGHTYRARVRMKDQAGRWSHWSAPYQFVAATSAE